MIQRGISWEPQRIEGCCDFSYYENVNAGGSKVGVSQHASFCGVDDRGFGNDDRVSLLQDGILGGVAGLQKLPQVDRDNLFAPSGDAAHLDLPDVGLGGDAAGELNRPDDGGEAFAAEVACGVAADDDVSPRAGDLADDRDRSRFFWRRRKVGGGKLAGFCLVEVGDCGNHDRVSVLQNDVLRNVSFLQEFPQVDVEHSIGAVWLGTADADVADVGDTRDSFCESDRLGDGGVLHAGRDPRAWSQGEDEVSGPGDFSDDADVEGAGRYEADCDCGVFENAAVGVADDVCGF